MVFQMNLLDGFSDVKTRKSELLDKMDMLIPWKEWTKIVTPFYKQRGNFGEQPFPLGTMLRIFVLQNLYDLADMAVMYEVIEGRSFSKFVGVTDERDVPNGDTIGRFRNLLEKHNLQEKFFEQVKTLLEQKGLLLKKGTIVDSTIISAPSSTKNKEKKRDPDAHQVKKGNEWRFGYKAHVGVDSKSKIVHSIVVTAANVHDVIVAEKLLHGQEETVHGDSGYLGIQKRISNKKIKFKINRRPSQYKKNSLHSVAQIKHHEHKKSSVRAKVEHVFGVVKKLFGFRKTRYRGLAKQTAKANVMFALSNLYLCGNA